MNRICIISRRELGAAFLGTCGFLALASAMPAQTAVQATTTATTTEVAAEPVFVELGHASVTFSDGNRLSTAYTLSATQPTSSKLTGQKLRFVADSRIPNGSRSVRFDINTGAHKTVKQLVTTLAGIFDTFVSGKAAAGQELGKIGDLSHGGEIHFVAESPGVLRMDILTQGTAASQRKLDHADASAFADLLRQASR